MSEENFTLSYSNEDDKAYGLAGMAISLAALDALDSVVGVSLDADGPMVTFAHKFYFSGSPVFSPKATWDSLLHKYYITVAMVLSNVMSRTIVRLNREIPIDILGDIHKEIIEEGKDSCSLDEDEIEILFNKTQTYMGRIFRNPRLHPAIEEFTRTLSRRRSLSGNELLDELRHLSII